MSYVLAEREGWLQSNTSSPPSASASDSTPFPVEVLQTFKNLRDGVNKTSSDGEADFFMWEHFTSKKYYDSGEIKRVGEIYTPWPSWHIAASNTLLTPSNWTHPTHSSPSNRNPPKGPWSPELEEALRKINQGVAYFEENEEEAVEYISTHLDYSEEDARAWLDTVRFARDVRGVDKGVVRKTVGILRTAGVLGEGVDEGGMVAAERGVV